jgi:hypothetical protein
MSTWPLEGTTPLISDRYINTYYCGTNAITMGQLLYLSANNTVQPTTSANLKTIVGFAMTSATSGQKVSVASRGCCRATAYGTIAAGDQITSASGGAAGCIQTDNSTLNTTIIGQCIQGAASGGTAIIMLW